EEGDVVEIRADGYRIADSDGNPVQRPIVESQLTAGDVELGNYAHYMQKEIFEQPGAIANTLEMVQHARSLSPGLFGAEAQEIFARMKQVLILACGTSYHAGKVAKYWLESIAAVPVSVEIASEYRYRESVSLPDTLVITISQSGETADTLAALQHAKSHGLQDTLSICNVPESALIRQSKLRFLTRAGPAIGVASTKALGRDRQRIPRSRIGFAARHIGHHHLAIGRDCRHAGRLAARQVARPAGHPVHLQRARVGADSPEQAALPDAGRPGDRCRLDQGV